MVYIPRVTILKISNTSLQLIRKFHCNPVMSLNLKWREDNKLPVNPNSFGPLTNLPDYSFTDNRVVPYGIGQKNRIDKQRELLIKMKKLVNEVDNAILKNEQLKLKAEEEKQKILNSKLKKKGTKTLKLPSKELKVNSVEISCQENLTNVSS
jgi:large subunit ribosomal protein L52